MSSYRYLQLQFNTAGFILIFFISMFVTPFSNKDKPDSHCP